MATLSQILPLAINASIFLIVFALGARTKGGDVGYLLHHPALLAKSVISMNIAMVAVAAAIAALFQLDQAIEVALIALAVSPVPPILPGKQIKAGGSASYAISMLVAVSVSSILLAPLSVWLVGTAFGRDAVVAPGKIVVILLISVLVPLALGIALRARAPNLAARLAQPASRIGTILLVIEVLPVLFDATTSIWHLVGEGVIVVLVVFSVAGLAIGHLLGGPEPQTRTVLALATGTRHPGVAIAIASVNASDSRTTLAVILYHLVIGAVISLPYVRLRFGRRAEQLP